MLLDKIFKKILRYVCLQIKIKLSILETSRKESVDNVVSIGSLNNSLSLVAM